MIFCSCLLALLVLLYVFFDVNYFIRIAFTIGLGRLLQKKMKVRDTSSIYGICTTQDVDIFMRHMNNARYLRELDFARFHFYDRSGIYNEVLKRRGNAMQGASSVRYRRTIPIFSLFRVETKLIHWDEKSIYLEQQFITLTDGFVRAIALSKQNIGGIDVPDMMKSLLGESATSEAPPELSHWLQSVEIASAKLRKTD